MLNQFWANYCNAITVLISKVRKVLVYKKLFIDIVLVIEAAKKHKKKTTSS